LAKNYPRKADKGGVRKTAKTLICPQANKFSNFFAMMQAKILQGFACL
jgi:hypothetical protein